MRMQRFGTFNAVLPPEGPAAWPSNLDFSKATEYTVDMSDEIDGGKCSYISGFYINNRGNPAPVEVEVGGSGQRMTIPADRCAYMPALITDSAQVTFRSAQSPNANGVQVFMVNFPVWPCVF